MSVVFTLASPVDRWNPIGSAQACLYPGGTPQDNVPSSVNADIIYLIYENYYYIMRHRKSFAFGGSRS